MFFDYNTLFFEYIVVFHSRFFEVMASDGLYSVSFFNPQKILSFFCSPTAKTVDNEGPPNSLFSEKGKEDQNISLKLEQVC